MGAPKQKWTPEEEAALKAGVLKHGPGKWRTILKDPQFSGVLYLRSNVDLKDKWRNMSVMANGWGSRERARLALKRIHPGPAKHGESSMALSSLSQSDDEIVDGRRNATSGGSSPNDAPKRSIMRLDNLIMEAIRNLREPGGSNKTSIATYIEDQYWAPPNFKRILSAKLKHFAATGKLIKLKRKYKIASASALSERRKTPSTPMDGRLRISPRIDLEDVGQLSKTQIDSELAKMRNMTPQEAASAAAQAVAEAEAAMAEAEEAAREAEAAEADAEAAQAFAEAALKTLKARNNSMTRWRIGQLHDGGAAPIRRRRSGDVLSPTNWAAFRHQLRRRRSGTNEMAALRPQLGRAPVDWWRFSSPDIRIGQHFSLLLRPNRRSKAAAPFLAATGEGRKIGGSGFQVGWGWRWMTWVLGLGVTAHAEEGGVGAAEHRGRRRFARVAELRR
ncbi:telomere repeat-binding factor 1 [Phtheirospermum japonicum]|uniref:MYB transcription factor n=1 Tax=Phtheirospermum japonicum TaxID=374723 RepID=A0A830C2Z6_9LAMI|nr:telomere repeat-binding factor 1 [Phtheirospermum japonicum]